MLGFMTFGVWHERESGKARGRNHSCCSHYAPRLWPSESGTSKKVANQLRGRNHSCCSHYDFGLMTFGVWHELEKVAQSAGQKPQLLFSSCLGLWPSESGTSEKVAKRGLQKPQLLFSSCLGLWPSESGTSEKVAKRGAEFHQLLFSSCLGLWRLGVWHEQDLVGKARGKNHSCCSHHALVYDLRSLARARKWQSKGQKTQLIVLIHAWVYDLRSLARARKWQIQGAENTVVLIMLWFMTFRVWQ